LFLYKNISKEFREREREREGEKETLLYLICESLGFPIEMMNRDYVIIKIVRERERERERERRESFEIRFL